MTKFKASPITFSRNTTGSTYVAIGQILELGKVGSSRALIDASAYGDDWMDYLTGQQDGSEVSLRLAFDAADAQHVALKTDYDAGTSKKFHLVHAGMTPTRTLELTAIVTEYAEGGDKDGVYEAECTLKIVNPGVVVVP